MPKRIMLRRYGGKKLGCVNDPKNIKAGTRSALAGKYPKVK